MSKLCLNMIVKNESHIIAETLRNIITKTPVDYWVISDTGSTDNTIECIKNTMQELGISGEVFQDNWVDFAHNRNLALKHAEGKADYILFFDADDYIEGDINWPESWVADAYYMNMTSENKNVSYRRQLIVKNGISRWRGVLHEFIDLPPNSHIDSINGEYRIISGRKGSRSLDPNKYLNDAVVLEKAIEEKQDIDLLPRNIFYCAQSYMDAGQQEKAIYWYKKRVACNSGWSEEAYMSCARLGAMLEDAGNEPEAIYYFTLGTHINPMRAECWYQLARLNSWKGRHDISYLFAQKASSLNQPPNILFANDDIYQYWRHYQLFISAYNTNQLDVAYIAFKNLIHASAPKYLYLDQIKIIKALKQHVLKDDFESVIRLKTALNLADSQDAIQALELC